jgi:hypothetical protein
MGTHQGGHPMQGRFWASVQVRIDGASALITEPGSQPPLRGKVESHYLGQLGA